MTSRHVNSPTHHHSSPPRRRDGEAASSRGHVLPKLLTIIVVGGAIWAYKFTAAPASLMARIKSNAPSPKTDESHRQFLESLGRLIEQSKQVLAVHDRGATPYIEIVLWKEDQIHPGVIDPFEVALISQSLVTQSITVYSTTPETLADSPARASTPKGRPRSNASNVATSEHSAVHSGSSAGAGAGALPPGQVSSSRSQSITQTALNPTLLAQSSFCDRWRASPQVRAQVIATGISDLSIQTLGPEPDELSLLRLTLRWAGNSADGHQQQEQSVLVQHPAGDQ
jgi:hypothetical protein